MYEPASKCILENGCECIYKHAYNASMFYKCKQAYQKYAGITFTCIHAYEVHTCIKQMHAYMCKRIYVHAGMLINVLMLSMDMLHTQARVCIL